jgi:hypothetical protein
MRVFRFKTRKVAIFYICVLMEIGGRVTGDGTAYLVSLSENTLSGFWKALRSVKRDLVGYSL